jgi:hypothetical protein
VHDTVLCHSHGLVEADRFERNAAELRVLHITHDARSV